MPEEESKNHNVFLYILLLSCVVVIATSFYFFYFKKDYNFIVETACDNTKDTCFHRDCSVEGDCPPNNLSYYNQYTIKARDFSACVNEDCTSAIQSGVVQGEKTECTEEDLKSEVCVAPEPVIEEVAPIVEEIKANKKK